MVVSIIGRTREVLGANTKNVGSLDPELPMIPQQNRSNSRVEFQERNFFKSIQMFLFFVLNITNNFLML